MSDQKQVILFDGDQGPEETEPTAGAGEQETEAEPEADENQVNLEETDSDTPGECEDECQQEEEETADKGKGRGKKGEAKAKSAAQTIATPTPAETAKYAGGPAPAAAQKPAAPGGKTFTYPFLVRGAGNIEPYDLWQLEHGRAYTVAEIRTALIAAGYEEYQETDIDLTATSDGTTLIVHIKGSRKGGSRDA